MSRRGAKGVFGPKGRGGLVDLARGKIADPGSRSGGLRPLVGQGPTSLPRRRLLLALAGGALVCLVGAAGWWTLSRGADTRRMALPTTPAARYRIELAMLRPIEEEAVVALTAATGPRYVDDAQLLRALRDGALPAWGRVIAGLEGITPPPDVAALHVRLVAAARAEATALGRIATGLEQGDGVAVQIWNVEHRTARAELDAVAVALAAALTAPTADVSPKR